MIIDALENAHRYTTLHPRFEAAFAFIQRTDISNIEVGKYEIDGKNLHAAVSLKEGVAATEAKYEAHDHYIDIQVCPAGKENIGWKPRHTCNEIKIPYNEEKDVTIFDVQPDINFELKAGQFAIFFPEDVHGPMIGDGPIKKLVIKVKI